MICDVLLGILSFLVIARIILLWTLSDSDHVWVIVFGDVVVRLLALLASGYIREKWRKSKVTRLADKLILVERDFGYSLGLPR